MAFDRQATCYYTVDGQTDLVLHNAHGSLLQGRKGSTFDGSIPRNTMDGSGKFTYTGALGTFSGVQLKRHDG